MNKCAHPKCQNFFNLKSQNQKYCSSTCANRHRINRHREKLFAFCPLCGDKMAVNSSKCRKCCKSNLLTRTIGSMGKNSTHRAARIRQHARKIWNDNGRFAQCYICGYNKHYEIAHVKPIASFSEDTTLSVVNHINNLLALCPTHHWELDNGILDLKDGALDPIRTGIDTISSIKTNTA